MPQTYSNHNNPTATTITKDTNVPWRLLLLAYETHGVVVFDIQLDTLPPVFLAHSLIYPFKGKVASLSIIMVCS